MRAGRLHIRTAARRREAALFTRAHSDSDIAVPVDALVVTVLSLVHVKASADVKWLWPALIGTPIVAWATHDGPDPRRMRVAVHAIVAVALAFVLYIATVSPPVFQLRR